MVWPSSTKWRYSGSRSSRSRRLSIMRTSRARKASNGWYHSRSQWVWETTTSVRFGSDVMAGPRRKVVHTLPPHQILRGDAGFCAPPLFALSMTQHGSIMRTRRARKASNGWYHSRSRRVWETTTSTRVGSDVMAGRRTKVVHAPLARQIPSRRCRILRAAVVHAQDDTRALAAPVGMGDDDEGASRLRCHGRPTHEGRSHPTPHQTLRGD